MLTKLLDPSLVKISKRDISITAPGSEVTEPENSFLLRCFWVRNVLKSCFMSNRLGHINTIYSLTPRQLEKSEEGNWFRQVLKKSKTSEDYRWKRQVNKISEGDKWIRQVKEKIREKTIK